MAEYIDRANLIARIEYYVTHTPKDKGEHYAYSVMLNEILNRPAADVVPVVHGWWNANEICSLCGEKSTEGLDATIWNYWLPNYCPNCGAKMDGGTDNG